MLDGFVDSPIRLVAVLETWCCNAKASTITAKRFFIDLAGQETLNTPSAISCIHAALSTT